MKRTWTRIFCVGMSLTMCLGMSACTNTPDNNTGTTNTETPKPTEEKKTIDELIKEAEEKLKEGEYGSAKKLLVSAYERKNESQEAYKIYADLYLAYTVLGKKESAKSLHREVLDDLSEIEQADYIEYMKKTVKDCGLPEVTIPSLSSDSEDKKADVKEKEPETKKEETKVKDTKAPVFTMFSKDIYADLGEHFNYNDFFKASDDSKCSLTYDDSKINFNAEGAYPLYVTAKDEYGNTASDQATIHIVDNSFKYGAGIYKTNYEMNLRSQPSTNSSIVADVPKGTKMIFQKVTKQSDDSYWGHLSTGYVCIENKQGTYCSYYSSLQIFLAQYNDLDKFSIACGFGPGGIPAFGFTNIPKGLNYTITCNDGNIIY